MARRDVDLVVRAKDEAAKVLDQITKAVEQFTDASRGMDSSAEKSESSLGQLGAAVSKLQKEIGGLDVADRLTNQLTKAETRLSSMEQQVQETGAEVTRLERQVRQAGDSSDRYAQKLEGATRALERQKGKLKEAVTEQRELAKAQQQSERAQAKLTARQAALPALLDDQSQKAGKARQRYEELAQQIAETAEPSRTLQTQFEASARNTERQTAKLQELETEYAQIGGQIRAAGSAVTIFGQRSEQATANIARQKSVLSDIEGNYQGLKNQSSAAATQQGKLASELSNISRQLGRQEAEIGKAENAYADLAVAAGQTDQALERLTGGGLQKLNAELQANRKSAFESKREYKQLSAAAAELAGDISRAGVPTREQAEAFQRTVVAARLAKQEYITQRTAVELMGRAYRDTGTDIESIVGTQQRFVGILKNTTAALNQQRAAAQQNQAQIGRIFSQAARAASAQNNLGTQTRKTASDTERAATATGRLAAAYRQFYGDSRRSLSLLQRIRGEVLSLAASYAGLFAGIEVLRGTVDAYQTLEAVQSRLNVANGGDIEAAANDLDFLRRNAERLGISLGVLGTEYSKFAIATKNTNLEGTATRKIFLAVAEAARVNRSSTQEMQGVFTALTQIVSKGAVQMEELRQQLGDRLPGALKLMADGLGVTTAELTKMLEQGQVTSDALLPFADELTKRFGPGLGDALKSVTAQIGRLGNAAFESLVRFGQAGFIEAFGDFADRLTSLLNSADFRAFTERASSALASLVDFIGFAVENFRVLAAAGTAFLALRLTPLVIAIAGAFKVFAIDALSAAGGLRAVGLASTTATGRLTAVRGAVLGLTGALRVLLSTTGIGLLVAAIGAGVALWATEADSATEAMVGHEKIVNDVKNAYDETGRSVEAWRVAVENLTVTEARRNLRNLKDALVEATDAFDAANRLDGASFATTFFGANLSSGAPKAFNEAIRDLITRVGNGQVALEDLSEEVDKISEEFGDGSDASNRYAESLLDSAKRVEQQAKAVEEAEAVLRAKVGTDEEAKEALDELVGSIKESAAETETAAQKAEQFEAAILGLSEKVPDLKKELDLLGEIDAIDKLLEGAIATARTFGDVERAMRLANQAKNELTSSFAADVGGLAAGSTGVEAAASLLREFEGFRSTPYFDVNAQRVGFGSDTITLADGSIKKVVKGMRVSVEDANRDLIRRVGQEFLPKTREQVGGARFDTFSPQQQAALTSIAYNYGQLPGRIIAAVRTGSDQEIANAIRGLGGDNDGVNRSRRNKEAAIFLGGTDIEGQVRQQEKLAETQKREAERAAEEREKERAATQEQIQQGQFQVAQQQLVNAGKERQAEIEAAIREAKANDPNITQAELDAIAEQTGRLFDLKEAQKEATTEKEKAQKAEEAVNNLLQQRQALQQQLVLANKNGDAEQAENLKLRIGEINAELLAAIDNAKAMWAAVGGPEAQAAIEKLQVARLETQNFGTEAGNAYLQWNRVGDLFVNGLASAFDTFAKSVAEGQSVGEAARDAFLKFASDFLLQIARMIIQQAIFNALRSAFGGTSFGSLIGVGAAHTGGLIGSKRAGSGNQTRQVSPGAFAAARRMHSGGIVGLSPDEVPIIAQKGEEMLTRDDPRHMLNGGGGGSGKSSDGGTTIINTFDPEEVMDRALSSRRGAKVLVNAIRGSRTEIKAAIG